MPRQDTKATWKRFRDACDRFFTRRNADLAERKETWSANLAQEGSALRARRGARRRRGTGTGRPRRSAGCRPTGRTIGPVRRNKSEAVWQRFRTACDTFFDRYKRRDEIELEVEAGRSRRAGRRARSAGAGRGQRRRTAPIRRGLLEQVRSLRSRWNQSTPVVRHGADPLSARFVGALERALAAHPDAFRGTELDVEPNRQKMEKLCARVEGFLTDAAPPPANSSQALADMLREALASNTIGGRAGEEIEVAGDGRRRAPGAGLVEPPRPGAGRRRPRAHRALPPACTPFFDQYRRKVPPPADGAARREAGRRGTQMASPTVNVQLPRRSVRSADALEVGALDLTLTSCTAPSRPRSCRRTSVAGISSSGTVRMSFDSTTMSAYLPTFSEPFDSSSNAA